MSSKKKQMRSIFRDTCYKRDHYCCVMCHFKSSIEHCKENLDAHHITSRDTMPNGGYSKENGISLCSDCHIKAEEFHSTGVAYPGYAPEDLYKSINSSFEKAFEASKALKEVF